MRVEDVPQLRQGEFAVWEGRLYEAYNNPDNFKTVVLHALPDDPEPPPHEDLAPGRAGVVVEPDALEEWYRVRWLFTWRGEDFLVVKYADGVIDGAMQALDLVWARANGLDVYGREAVFGTFPVADIEDLREERVDILASFREHGEDWLA